VIYSFASNTGTFLKYYKTSISKKILLNQLDSVIWLFPGSHSSFNTHLFGLLTQKVSGPRSGIFCLIGSLISYHKLLSSYKYSDLCFFSHTVYCNIASFLLFLFSKNPRHHLFMIVSGFGPSRIRNSLRYRLLGRLYLTILRTACDSVNITVVALNPSDQKLITDFKATRYVALVREVGSDDELTVCSRPRQRAGSLNIGYIGRTLIEKGITDYIDVANHFNDSGVDVSFSICGTHDPSNSSSIDFRAISSNLPSNLSFSELSYRDYFASIDVLLFPSYREGHPYFLFQALSSGVVPIVYPSAGNLNDVIDNYNGLVAKTNQPSALIGLVYSLLQEDALLSRLSANAIHYSRMYTQDYVDNSFLRLAKDRHSLAKQYKSD